MDELTVDTVEEAKTGFDYSNFASDYDGQEIIYVTGEGYKLAIDMGNYTYILDLPDTFLLGDISNSPKRDTGKHGDDTEAKARVDAGIRPDISQEDFNKGFLDSDILVSVPVGALDLPEGADAVEIAQNFAESVKRNRKRITSRLLSNDEYVSLLTAELIGTGGDMKAAISNVEDLNAYGVILRDLGVTQNQIDSERMEYTDPVQYQKNYNSYYNLFTKTAAKSYGSELPESVIDYLATQTNKGYFSQAEALEQMNGIFDPSANIVLDNGVLNALEGISVATTKVGESDVQDLLDQYLPEHLHFSQEDIAKEAGKIRNNAGARESLIKRLKKTRFQFYNMYDEDISWQQIIQSKQQMAKSVLGQDLKSNDPLLDEIIKMNDSSKELERLRNYGLKTGNQKVKNDLAGAMMDTFGKGIVASRSYVG
tara:strand:+ start:6482 stop:7756 length:1275 start_codon:yes stop_codon:yes gene_type:complete